MDFPGHTFDELTALAQNRQRWKAGSLSLDPAPKRHHGISRSHLRRGIQPPPQTTSTAPNTFKPNTIPSPTTSAKRYIIRDRHEAFFRPVDDNLRAQQRQQQIRNQKRKKQKPAIWTDKQRAAWAYEHYCQHHGQPTTTTQCTHARPRLSSSKRANAHTTTTPTTISAHTTTTAANSARTPTTVKADSANIIPSNSQHKEGDTDVATTTANMNTSDSEHRPLSPLKMLTKVKGTLWNAQAQALTPDTKTAKLWTAQWNKQPSMTSDTDTNSSSLWAPPAMIPSSSSTPSQTSTDLTDTQSSSALTSHTPTPPPRYNHLCDPILGHRNDDHTHSQSPMFFPTLSPITHTITLPNLNDTYIHVAPDNLIEHLPNVLTSLNDTYLLHPMFENTL